MLAIGIGRNRTRMAAVGWFRQVRRHGRQCQVGSNPIQSAGRAIGTVRMQRPVARRGSRSNGRLAVVRVVHRNNVGTAAG